MSDTDMPRAREALRAQLPVIQDMYEQIQRLPDGAVLPASVIEFLEDLEPIVNLVTLERVAAKPACRARRRRRIV